MNDDFAVQLMHLLLFVMILVGSLCLLDVLFRPRRRTRRRPQYWMAYDLHDDQRRIERNGFKSRIGAK